MSGPCQQQFNPGNQRFTSGEELRVYLEGLDPDYVAYTDKLWRANYTSIRKLANADTAHLVQAGVVVAAATDIVKASGAALAVATGAGAGPSVVRLPRQVDALSLATRAASMFATIRIINDHIDPPVQLEAEVLVDSGCHAEIILPKRKLQQLRLDVMDTSRARGFGDAITDMIVYRSVKAEVDLTDVETGEVLSTRRADLVPQCKSNDPDCEPSHQDARLHEFAGLRGQSADGGVVKLSPVKRNPAGTLGLLGFLALHKLKLRLDPEGYQLLRVTEDELILQLSSLLHMQAADTT